MSSPVNDSPNNNSNHQPRLYIKKISASVESIHTNRKSTDSSGKSYKNHKFSGVKFQLSSRSNVL